MPAARRAAPQRTALWLIVLLVLLLHTLTLSVFSRLLRPPSLLRQMAPPLYTRTLAPETPPTPEPVPTAAPVAQPNRPAAAVRTAPAARKKVAKKAPASAPAPAATSPEPPADSQTDVAAAPSAPEPPASAPPLASAPSATAAADPASAPATAAPSVAEAAASPASSASAAAAAYLASWPGDTRLSYQLGGWYRGELHGSGQVLWQREGSRYQITVAMNAGLLASLTFSSQGQITANGLRPEVYEEDLRGRRRGVRMGEDEIRLQRGERLPRPEDVQDAASQFVELGHRFATGQIPLRPGGRVDFVLARPGGVDPWTYDVVGEETLHLPELGPVRAMHLKPRPLDRPRGPIMAEIWFAPSLQYLPVRIRISTSTDSHIDLLVRTVEQR